MAQFDVTVELVLCVRVEAESDDEAEALVAAKVKRGEFDFPASEYVDGNAVERVRLCKVEDVDARLVEEGER